MIYSILLFALLYTAGLLFFQQAMKSPPRITVKNLRTAVTIKQDTKTKFFALIVNPLVKPLSLVIPMEKQKERILKANLARAGLDMTPKEYYARAIVVSALTLPLTLFMLVMGFGVLTPVTLAFTVVIYLHFITDLKERLKKKREAIENGLPNFIRSILYKVGSGENGVVKADLIQIFEDYHQVIEQTGENEIFSYDIAVLIMEMKSMDIETALRNFDERMSFTPVSFLVQALIGISRGENQSIRLEALAKDMAKLANENLKRELDKRPGKVRLAIIPLVVIAVVSLLYVIITHLITSIGVLF